MKTRRMSLVVAGLAAIAFALAFALSAAPQLHEQLHDVSATHQCAVTLISSGNCEHACAASPQCAPDFAPLGAALIARHARIVAHAVDSALLEHAPPSLS